MSIMESSSLYESINLLPFDSYYYDSFVIFLLFIKPNVNKDYMYNNFIIDIAKNYYIYAHYDYYFYYDKRLLELLIKNVDKKDNIFSKFCNHLCEKLKCIKIINYPPFINNNVGIDDIIYYSFDIPNYFKFNDFIKALCYVFKINNTNYIDVVKSFEIKKNNIEQNQPINNINTKNSIPTVNKLNNNKITNGFVENYNSSNKSYILNTDKI